MTNRITAKVRTTPAGVAPIAVRACDPEVRPGTPGTAPPKPVPKVGRPRQRAAECPPLQRPSMLPAAGPASRPLPIKEVLDESRFAGIFWLLADSDPRALLDLEGLANHQKPSFCRYLSPLPDSNRGPPPYHGSSEAVTAYTPGHLRSRSSCKPVSYPRPVVCLLNTKPRMRIEARCGVRRQGVAGAPFLVPLNASYALTHERVCGPAGGARRTC